MKISIITLFPDMISGFFKESIIKRAQEKGLVEIELVNLRDFALDDYGSVDDRPYGGGAGMILRVEPIYNALQKIKSSEQKITLTSPKGKIFTQKKAQEYSKEKHLIIIAGHYEEVDERVRDYIDEEISMGDFVMTGGEITAAAMTDAIVRLLPGVLKKEEASQEESFFKVPLSQLEEAIGHHPVLKELRQRGLEKIQLLEYPQYTRPEEFMGKKVPEVLLQGNHKEIEKWRLKKAFEDTIARRTPRSPRS